MQFFYTPDATEGIFKLDADESRHCLRVLRKKIGEAIDVIDGKGNLYHAEISSDKGKICELRTKTVEKEHGRRDYKVSIGIAISKNAERLEWFLEKATEVGIDAIHPMITERTERTKLNVERFRKILISAMKQSGKTYLPLLFEPAKLSDVLKNPVSGMQAFIAVCGMGTKHLKDVYQKGKDAMVLIGPEGDFTEGEVNAAIEKGFTPVSLGRSRLRIETAGMVACHTITLMNE